MNLPVVFRVVVLAGVCLVALLAVPAFAGATVEQQRAQYREALAALRAGDDATFTALAEQLENYPLYPYLRYFRLRARLATAPTSELQAFLDDYADTPLAYRLRGAWLRQLADAGHWRQFLQLYDQRPDVALKCYDLRARIRAGQLAGVADATAKLWLVGHSQPPQCDRLFRWMHRSGQLTAALVWQRIYLAMDNNQPGLAGHLAHDLNRRDRQWVALWQRVHRDPVGMLQSPQLASDTALVRRIVSDGIRQMIADDVDQAHRMWQRIRHRYAAGRRLQARLDRQIALYAALRHHPDALQLLHALPVSARDAVTREWVVRTAVRRGDWQQVIAGIDVLEPARRQQPQWRYWLARAYGQTGRHQQAQALYRQLAGERDYYGFLAADRLGQIYAIDSSPLPVDESAIAAQLQRPGIQRARELFALHDLVDARREWNWATHDLDRHALLAAAVLADRWNWHDTAIRTVARANEYDDLALRFPTPYQPQVAQAADNNQLKPARLYGIMRRESAFMIDARSRAGALGLMQIKPSTARDIARRHQLPRPAAADLLDGGQSIALGSAYLRYLLNRFNQNQVLAIAAYNAGPNRIDDWLPEHTRIAADRWIDSIPYPETRAYIHAVLAYTAIFEWALNDRARRLSAQMEPIDPGPELASDARASMRSG